jgi:hypothetical protein
MEKPGIRLVKIAVFADGAFLGALLARWLDQWLTARSRQQSEYDKARYAQGLRPLSRFSSRLKR